MPKKIRELIQKLRKAGFVDRGGKGSHRNFKHSSGVTITISGNSGSDAKMYQGRSVEIVICEVNSKNESK
ncbi:MAG: type II toxin-antitoxin system HicA family toxin [Candidatus Sabulitectum sp.]|nr:type II toxin-antitoxin system HicA family toxin [Candidatus Sabulitectum sp.]